MARADAYYLCFSPLSAQANGIRLPRNNSSIKSQSQKQEVEHQTFFKLASRAERWNFELLEIKKPTAADGSGEESDEKERRKKTL